MFLHVGSEAMVPLKEIVAIIDYRSTQLSPATREYLEVSRTEKRIIDLSSGSPKSVVITTNQVYLSPISSLTLKKRSDSFLYALDDLS